MNNKNIYTIRLVGSEEVIAKIDNVSTAKEDGYFNLIRPRIPVIEQNQLYFVPIYISVDSDSDLQLNYNQVQFLPKLTVGELADKYEQSTTKILLG